ncbi:hypothetical protein [Thermotalea metallivorans]|uniref:Uncharacterized protein n=1 Tax=Thermotalea metallivorans TaxID=520762 RepID=A0A140L1D9_9FIRM|nr:hypothetical protein [Thermotalea metallivorans]KXG74364.1 hypothetical protein AN619_24150 [Thermotalea metallivorans]
MKKAQKTDIVKTEQEKIGKEFKFVLRISATAKSERKKGINK